MEDTDVSRVQNMNGSKRQHFRWGGVKSSIALDVTPGILYFILKAIWILITRA